MIEPALEQLNAAELSGMRRELLRILNDVDPTPRPANREDVCRRIQRLCGDGQIPEPIGDLMHLVRRYRNRAEYEGLIPDGMEARAIRSTWAAIEDWRCTRRNKAPRKVENWLPARGVAT